MSSSNSHSNGTNRRMKGRVFEKKAADFFVKQGYSILEQNWTASHKEIDLIVRRENTVVFVEVKAASSDTFGHPSEKVDDRKIGYLVDAANQYLIDHKIEGCDLRFDVVTFLNGQLEYYPNAFDSP